MLKRYLAIVVILALRAAAQEFDTAIVNARVLDPESGLDAVRSIGIKGGRITAISPDALRARKVIDAKGLAVAPGFIDLHSHGQKPENYRFQARDGVTTALELEFGAWPVSSWYSARTGKALINFGASSGHIPATMAVLHDSGTVLPRDEAVKRSPTRDEQRAILEHVKQGLDEGALGVGLESLTFPRSRANRF